MLDRVASILSNKTHEDFGLSEEDMDRVNEVNPVFKKIAEPLGELLENLEIDCDQVDQLCQLFIVLTPDNIAQAEKNEKNRRPSEKNIEIGKKSDKDKQKFDAKILQLIENQNDE